ncbi:hypothetical protein STH2372 [Symbiobacterium thermophilum IAM 14863]|uniref:Uncharacterized protein n=1 Tax=Symbiobacterium thermophilum (strain DSM 24528 / JCM 14929 / IAM 14863 / T) TaxID=292459 RepID=Q67LT9_SYMTH|nr:hypothetical protein STH2372 [Symbiobacterium thermophilum IAM 14863]
MKPVWVHPQTLEYMGRSIVEKVYAVKVPKGLRGVRRAGRQPGRALSRRRAHHAGVHSQPVGH